MFRYIYWTTRSRNYDSSLTLDQISMNWGYTTEFFNKGQFRDFEEAGIVTLSMPIPNERFTARIPKIDENENVIGSVPKLTRFVMMKYSDLFTTEGDLKLSIEKSSSDTVVDVFADNASAIEWIKANTDLVEIEPWYFLIREASEGIIPIWPIEAVYLDLR